MGYAGTKEVIQIRKKGRRTSKIRIRIGNQAQIIAKTARRWANQKRIIPVRRKQPQPKF